jgi:two-component system cell cycle sensor histidine kinase/response regulator CckA
MLGSGYKELQETITGLMSELVTVKAENERLHMAMQQMPVIVWKTDTELRVTWSEGAGLSLWQSVPSDLVGRPLTEVFGTSDPHYPPLAAARRALQGEMSQYVRDVKDRSYQSRLGPLRDSEGKISGIIGVTIDITEQRRAVEAAAASRARLAGIINISEDAIISIDANQNITLFNPGAEKMFGYTAAEVMGRPLDLLLPARFMEAHRHQISDFAKSDDVLRPMARRREIRARRKDGTEVPAEASISKFEVAGEIVLNVRLRDITERKLAAEMLRSRARQQSAVAEIGLRALRGGNTRDLMNEACALVAQTLKVEFVKVLELLPGGDSMLLLAGSGWREGIAGSRVLPAGPGTLAAYTLASTQPVILRNLQTDTRFSEPLLAEHGIVSGMTVILHGHERPFGLLGAHSASPREFTRDDINFLQAVANVLAAAVERMSTEEELRKSNETLRALNEAAPVAVLTLDLEGRVQFWNPAARRLFGWSEDEVPGRRLLELPGEQFENLRRGERLVGFEIRRQRKNGSLVEAGIWSAPLRDANGAVRATLIIAVDLTERKRMEEKLRETQKLESIGLLAGGIAHDFNNLLTGILGNVSLASEQIRPDDPARQLLERSLRSTDRAADLVRQLLAYAGKGRFVLQPIDLSWFVHDMQSQLRESLPRQVQLELELADDLPPIEGDLAQMQQVLMNLANNAAEAIGNRPGTVLIRTGVREIGEESEELAPGRYVRLEIHDDGSGMDESTLAQAFDPFFSTKFTGRGLGLAAVSGIVRSHNGAVRVCSKPGQGSTFEILLPAFSPKILIVGEEGSAAALVNSGYSVVLAGDGQRAMELFEEAAGQFSVVLLLDMPASEDIPARLKAIRNDVCVIVSSDEDEAEAMRRFNPSAVSGFIQKPYAPAQLAGMVKSALAKCLSETRLQARNMAL